MTSYFMLFSCSLSDLDDTDFYINWAAKIHVLLNCSGHGLRFPLTAIRGKLMNLRPGQPMPCEGNWVVSLRCWQDIDLHSVYNCENELLSLMQFNHMHTNSFIAFIVLKKQCSCNNHLNDFPFNGIYNFFLLFD